ncbi:MAG: DUF790 family protein [Candidatus Calescibacterium sp.]|nr:DUF790 family protein [Candidatus Calescibacterium sp.]MCX7734344.1 DUF790 family protein [bacterium]MDW8087615.1 DUF790 family protein [Candidatus Calescibacterium sp.]
MSSNEKFYLNTVEEKNESIFIIPKELLNFKIIGRKIVPKFIEQDEADIIKLFELWKNSLGKTKKEIREKFQAYENFSNYKKIRGYFYILSRISDFRKAFERAGELREFLFGLGPALSESERQNIAQKAKSTFGIKLSSDTIWGDLDENSVLEGFKEMSVEETIKLYNFSLLCGIALLSHKIKFRTTNIGKVLRYIKKLKLMYDIDTEGWIYVFGPESILTESQKYKLQLSKCFYYLLKQKNSDVIVETKKGTLEISPKNLKYIPEFETEEEKYDSKIEEDISKLIKDAIPYATIQRETDAFLSKSGIFIPDFKIKSAEKEVFLEIVGFWTKQYIERKIEKLSDFKREIVLIASEENSIEIKQKIPQHRNLIVFSKKIPYLEIIKKMKELIGYTKKQEEIQERTNQRVLDELREKLKDQMDFSEASEIIKSKDLDVKSTLKILGFEILWESLIPPKGKIVKKTEK